jgi:transposase
VWEVSRPDRQARRHQGKSDPVDAQAAARATAAKARTQTANALRALVVTAQPSFASSSGGRSAAQLASTAARLRPGPMPPRPQRPSWPCACWASAIRPWTLSWSGWTLSLTG